MAGLPNYSDNPVIAGNYTTGVDAQGKATGTGDMSMEIALATKMQLILDQPMSDLDTGLVNRDFEGDFFKIGDTVAIVKPDVSSLRIESGKIGTQVASGEVQGDGKPHVTEGQTERYINKDARLIPSNVKFDKNLLTIDSFTKYAFYISDFTKAEGKWNYESGNLEAVAQEMRKAHNLETAQMIVNAGINTATSTVATLGSSPTAPIEVANGDELYEKVIVEIFAQLYDKGAITADGQISYGSNPQQAKQTYGKIYLPTRAYTTLLVSKYLQDRATVAADEKVATGKVKTVMGLDVAIEPSLNPKAKRHVEIAGAADGVVAIIAGTRNFVTRAGKVLPPEKLRSQKFFADEFHGCELYGQKITEPEAGVVVFVKLPQ